MYHSFLIHSSADGTPRLLLCPGYYKQCCDEHWSTRVSFNSGEVSQKEKHQYSIITHIYGIYKDGNDNPVCETAKETQIYRTVFWILWERVRVG